MQNYIDCVKEILEHGREYPDRTGVGRISLFGGQMEFDLSEQFPLVSIKKTNFEKVATELVWMLAGSTNANVLNDLGVNLWDEWKNTDGQLGPVYGSQWRRWDSNGTATYGGWSGCGNDVKGGDQLTWLVREIIQNPNSSRLILSAWNVEALPKSSLSPEENADMGLMALPPCHLLSQYYCRSDSDVDYLDCHLYMRSSDVALGLPYNIAGYATMTHIIARMTNRRAGRLIISFGDRHVYDNQIRGISEMLQRTPLKSKAQLNLDHVDFSFLSINPSPDIDCYDTALSIDEDYVNTTNHDDYDDIYNDKIGKLKILIGEITDGLSDYQHHPHIHIPVAK